MGKIKLRPAALLDAEIVFDWRNAPQTRQYSFDSRPLNRLDHISWFDQSLKMSNRCLLIAELDNKPIGVLRYDLAKPYAEISIYLDPGLAGKGLGTIILVAGVQWMQQYSPEITTLRAKIIPDNIASVRAFEKAGFSIKAQGYEKNIKKD